MRENVEEPGAGGLGEGFEVPGPDAIRVSHALPDVVAVVVHPAFGEEVDRTDHVVELVRIEQIRDPVLPALDEVHLDPKTKRCFAHEVAVRGKIVAGVLLPEGVLPDLKRLRKAVDVL
jgi:hypothetical protein